MTHVSQQAVLQPVRLEPKREGSCSPHDEAAGPSAPVKPDPEQPARVWALLNSDTAARRCAWSWPLHLPARAR